MKRICMISISTLMMVFFISIVTVAAPERELTLDESVKLALENNRDVKIAVKDQEAASWRLRELKSNHYPVLELSHTDSRVKPDPSDAAFRLAGINPPKTNYFENKLSMTLPLYTGGQLEGSIKQMELNLKLTDLNVDKVGQQVKLDTTVAYYNVLQARSMVKLCEEAVAGLKAHLEKVKAFLEAGMVTPNDVLRTEVALSSDDENLIKAQNGYDLALANLNNILGLPLDSKITVMDNLSYVKYDNSLQNCTELALKNRPEVSMVDINCEIAKKGVVIAKGGYLPTVSLVGINEINDTKFPGNNNNNWSVNLVSSWKLYNGGQTNAQIKQAVSSWEKASEVADQAKEGISLEVRQAYLNLKEAEKRIQTTQLAVDKAKEDVDLIQVRYQAGLGTNLDVIDAQLALTQAKTNYLNSLYDYNVGLGKLQRAVGM